MSSDNEILFLVVKQFTRQGKTTIVAPTKVFRTRAAARKYASDMRAKSKRYIYKVLPASWGPEQ